MNKILIANWKMNPAKEADAVKLAKGSDVEGVILCPPFPFLIAVKKATKKAKLGAQDLCFEPSGSFTGEVSAAQLVSVGVEYVIVGHSERRAHLGETDELIGKKVAAALEAGLIPVVCVGETLDEREKGQTREVIDRQIRMAFSLIPTSNKKEKFNVIITYEPVWAISTNHSVEAGLGKAEVPTPAAVEDMISYMQGIVRGLPIVPAFLYGGSVNKENVESFLGCSGVHGGLVGAASLSPVDFKEMIRMVQEEK